MNRPLRSLGLGFVAWLFVFGIAGPRLVRAQSYTILHVFQYSSVSNDGRYLSGGLVQGSDGDFYGSSEQGGSADYGTIFKITPSGTVTVLHSFRDRTVANDGNYPVAGLIQARDGNFYGTTTGGGAGVGGTVFKITPQGTVTILHNFGDGSVRNDGIDPSSALVQGSDGNFYGTTYYGGSTVAADPYHGGYGTIFKITPSGTETILHDFRDGSVADDGAHPDTALVQTTDGDFYGVTPVGGSTLSQDRSHPGYGTVFKVTPTGAATILHNFGDGSVSGDGTIPDGALVQGADGSFYGTTAEGGSGNNGTVFKITPQGAVTITHRFHDGNATDGSTPESALIQGTDGDFYGSTEEGGLADYGTVFKITPSGTETILHNCGAPGIANDYSPSGPLFQGTDGSFYGTTQETVFEYNPAGLQPPTVASFTPSEGPVGSLVTLTGTNLGNVTAVRFHDASARSFMSSADGTHLTVTVPQGAMKGTITATNPAGSATSTTPFRITYAPVVTSFSPTSGPVGTVVTITGTHLDGITRVRFHEASAIIYSSNAAGTQLTVTVPPGAKTGTITRDNRDTLATTSTRVFTVTP